MNYQTLDEEEFRQGCEELADAIVAGCQDREQIQGMFWKRDSSCAVVGVCTLGGAYLHAEGFSYHDPYSPDVYATFPVLNEWVYAPVAGDAPNRFFDLITNLNDDKRWTPGQIAEWARTAKRVEAA